MWEPQAKQTNQTEHQRSLSVLLGCTVGAAWLSCSWCCHIHHCCCTLNTSPFTTIPWFPFHSSQRPVVKQHTQRQLKAADPSSYITLTSTKLRYMDSCLQHTRRNLMTTGIGSKQRSMQNGCAWDVLSARRFKALNRCDMLTTQGSLILACASIISLQKLTKLQQLHQYRKQRLFSALQQQINQKFSARTKACYNESNSTWH